MAVYSFLNDNDLTEISNIYGFDAILKADPIAEGVENTNYLISYLQNNQINKAILTIFEKRVNVQDLPFFLKLKQHLFAKNYPCPTPFLTKNENTSFQLQNKSATIVSFLQGSSILKPDVAHIRQAGIWLAKLHIATSDFKVRRANSAGYNYWCELARKNAIKAKTIQEHQWLQLINDELNFQQNIDVSNLPAGIIHADFFPNNVFFNDQQNICGVIDFYFACYDVFAYDIAIVTNAWCCDDNNQLVTEKFNALIEGYNSIKQLEDSEIIIMPTLLRAAALRFLVTRLHDVLYPADSNSLIIPHNPNEYVQKLEFFRNYNHLNF